MRRFVIYIDILGFSRMIREAKNVCLDSAEIRELWVSRVNKRLIEAKISNYLTAFHYMEADSWMVISKAADDVYYLLDNLPNLGLPLEIAVHFDNFKKGCDPAFSDGVVSFLKNNLLKSYRELYKKKKGESIKQTFILSTRKAFEALGQDKFWEKPYPSSKYYSLSSKTL